MGKRYKCDYCDKSMAATPGVIKTHNKGLVHQSLLQEHYQQYKDVETILTEESAKKPCQRYITGNCKFGGICRFSHYTREQLQAIRDRVNSKKCYQPLGNQPSFQDLYNQLQKDKTSQSKSSDHTTDHSTVIYDGNGVTHVLPWQYNPAFDLFGDNLPPSLKRLKLEDFVNAEITQWG